MFEAQGQRHPRSARVRLARPYCPSSLGAVSGKRRQRNTLNMRAFFRCALISAEGFPCILFTDMITEKPSVSCRVYSLDAVLEVVSWATRERPWSARGTPRDFGKRDSMRFNWALVSQICSDIGGSSCHA
jgi:hypothetical protein